MAGRLLIVFIIVPIIELWLLIQVGRAIGVLPTLALVILTAIIGSQLVRRQGLGVLNRIRETQERGEPPALPLLNGAALLMAGLMLLTPGLITDVVGFVLLIPSLRESLARKLLGRVLVMTPFGQSPPNHGRDDDVIEGDYTQKPDARHVRGDDRNRRD